MVRVEPMRRERSLPSMPAGGRSTLRRASGLLLVLLLLVTAASLLSGSDRTGVVRVWNSETARMAFFSLRLPRVLLGAVIGSSLGMVGAALQAMFRNPLAEPFTLGVTGGGALGASLAIALGWGVTMLGVPLVFIAGFFGAGVSVVLACRVAARTAPAVDGTVLLAGLGINLTATAGVVILQFLVDDSRALQILRWTIGSLEIVGFGLLGRMLIFLIPGWLVLLFSVKDLHLVAMGADVARSLGVDVTGCERRVFLAASLIVGVTVSVGGAIAFVGLVVPHIVRMLFGEDVRVVMPCSFLLGASFLMAADSLARTALESGELPVGAVTALIGGFMFLWLLGRQPPRTAS